MISLPQPNDLTSLVLRTDFTDDTAWEAVKAALRTSEGEDSATFVSDPKYMGVSLHELVDADNAASYEDRLTYLFLADATTMTDVERPLLALDLADEPGRTFRVPPRWYADVSTNLTIANMDFAEFANTMDRSDTYRGFDRD
ncbi:hypothetical protein IW249_004281 [Micromonospora vinacea]|uniref:DUF6924 domain-containing protein n=1 Tax=Micromonospora vinacea TaxID=709878 RepID=A0ABS0K5H6_9ACTN|nr:hypothetical protein [Micromonospora vinacea]MBG6103867.1 hypothetical protein [Micromonospora vinacea]